MFQGLVPVRAILTFGNASPEQTVPPPLTVAVGVGLTIICTFSDIPSTPSLSSWSRSKQNAPKALGLGIDVPPCDKP